MECFFNSLSRWYQARYNAERVCVVTGLAEKKLSHNICDPAGERSAAGFTHVNERSQPDVWRIIRRGCDSRSPALHPDSHFQALSLGSRQKLMQLSEFCLTVCKFRANKGAVFSYTNKEKCTLLNYFISISLWDV